MTKTLPAALLHNKTILVTRPLGREKQLRDYIEMMGGSVLHYPTISIQPPASPEVEQLLSLGNQLHKFTMAIFISQTAVQQSQIYFPKIPDDLTIVSIGSKTSHALKQQNIHVNFEAERHNTESLLQADEFQSSEIRGQNILIFRGIGGRALLGDTLKQRGATIRYVELYKREIPQVSPLTTQQITSLDALTASSKQGLDNLMMLIKETDRLVDIPIVLPSIRTAKQAKRLGFVSIILAKNATDEATISALTEFFQPL